MTHYQLDLHGCTWSEALQNFIDFYNHSLDQNTDPAAVQLSVIHGYGSTGLGGAIRKRLRAFLIKHSDCLEFTPGENVDGNQGCTTVKLIKRLPDEKKLLAEAIRNYCERPRTQSKIMVEFRKHGHPEIIQAIRSLEKRGWLAKQSSVGVVRYVSR